MGLGQDTTLPALSIPLGKETGLAQMNGCQAVTYGVQRGPMLCVGVRAMTGALKSLSPVSTALELLNFLLGSHIRTKD